MDAFYCDTFELPLPPQHRFPMSKYRLLRERVSAVANDFAINLLLPPAATDDQLLLVHTEPYLQQVKSGTLAPIEQRRIGFPWSPGLVERSRRSTGATIAAAESALVDGRAVNLAGGTHHAFADRGQGFCVFNDVAVAIRYLQSIRQINSALVIDCDVHQGNGTAAIFDGDDSVFTTSLHGDSNFPFAKTSSDVDLAFPEGTTGETYLPALRECLDQVANQDFDITFFVAGADPFEGDRLGKLALSKQELLQRDQLVAAFCGQQKTPLVAVMGGGYADDVHDIVDVHLQTVTTMAFP